MFLFLKVGFFDHGLFRETHVHSWLNGCPFQHRLNWPCFFGSKFQVQSCKQRRFIEHVMTFQKIHSNRETLRRDFFLLFLFVLRHGILVWQQQEALMTFLIVVDAWSKLLGEGPCCNGYWFQCSCCLRWELNVFLHLKCMYVKFICVVGVIDSLTLFWEDEALWMKLKACKIYLPDKDLLRHFWRSKPIRSLGWKKEGYFQVYLFFCETCIYRFCLDIRRCSLFLWQPKAANDRHFAGPESIFAKSQVALIDLNFIKQIVVSPGSLFASWARN